MDADPTPRPARVRFGPEPLGLGALLLLLLGSLPLASTVPALAWLPVLPLLAGVWVLRARVVADDAGLQVCNGLARRSYPWRQVSGFDVPGRGPVRLLLTEGTRVPLTALRRDELPRLLAVGRGRS